MACIKEITFMMDILEEIFEIRSCIEILANNISKSTQMTNICSTGNKELQSINKGHSTH